MSLSVICMENSLYAYIYDFLSVVFEEDSVRQKIDAIILYGSVAKGTSDAQSDIDLFFATKHRSNNQEVERMIKHALNSFEVQSEKTWALRGQVQPISYIIGSLQDETWKSLRDELISSGIVLYGSYHEAPSGIAHYALFSYSLASLERRHKMKFIRALFGYHLKKGRTLYTQQGLLERKGGIKLGSNAILVRQQDITDFKAHFSQHKIRYKIMETWVRI